MRKQERQAIILKLIEQFEIGNQDDLQTRLTNEDVSVTLATLSRDLKELHVVKEPVEMGRAIYRVMKPMAAPDTHHFQQRFSEVVVDFTQVEFMNVIKTTPSDGNALAALIDELDEIKITGTLAGHDTILVISPDRQSAIELHEQWVKLLAR
ncbi:arginine repressor [Furfurilactobacillus curtus]|uniref:Arginine repressor n=1 Tax=Furfurilactobacillus curtus TaxID=1746200 RepID=A0ABQ5JL71_9LACO